MEMLINHQAITEILLKKKHQAGIIQSVFMRINNSGIMDLNSNSAKKKIQVIYKSLFYNVIFSINGLKVFMGSQPVAWEKLLCGVLVRARKHMVR